MSAVSFMASSQTKVLLTADGRSMTATLTDNAATRELKAMLEVGPVTIQMSDYGGFEKVGALPKSLPTSNTQITTEPGDIMLYQGNNMVVFYGTNTWSYTRLGKIDGATAGNVKQFLGIGSLSLTISLDTSSDIAEARADEGDTRDVVCDLSGRPVLARPLSPGLYIINGKKIVVGE